MDDKVLKVLLVEDNDFSAQTTQAFLRHADTFEVQTTSTLIDALDLLENGHFDVVLLDLGLPDSDGLGTLTTIRLHAPQVPVLVLTATDNDVLANSALLHGAQDYIVKGQCDGNGLARALRYAVARQRQISENSDAPTVRLGGLIGVLGATGGAGSSTLAVHLALEIRRLTNQNVLLMDLDVNAGTDSFLMKLGHPYTVLDATLNLHRLDPDLWQSLVLKHSSGLDVLQSPGSVRFGEQLRGERVRHLLRFAQTIYDWIVVDMDRFNELSINLVDEMAHLLLISTGDIPALYEAKRIVQRLRELGTMSGQLRLILNRTSRMDVDVPELEKTFAMPISAFLPEGRRELHEAYAEGNLLPAGSTLYKQIARMAEDLTAFGHGSKHSGRTSLYRLGGHLAASLLGLRHHAREGEKYNRR